MRLANHRGRLVLVHADSLLDVETASRGEFAEDPSRVYDRWDQFVAWAADADLEAASLEPGVRSAFDPERLGPAVPEPRQVFAIGLNYRDHASEAGYSVPELPVVFTKFASCLTGPRTRVRLPPNGQTDWEVELVAVIGRPTAQVSVEDAWSHVAGLTVGQDLSERRRQGLGPAPQFSLAKSFPGFGPIGPWVVPVSEFPDPGDLELGCRLNGEVVQLARTSEMIFSVPQLVSQLSHIVALFPGDLVFTGTPSGVALGQTEPRWLRPGDQLESWVEGIGDLCQSFESESSGQS